MPAQIIHSYGGLLALEAAGIPGYKIDKDVFGLGCQGPDIFSHNRRTRPLALAYARMLHRRKYGSFSRNFASLISLDSLDPSDSFDFLVSWLYGFITHQVFDRLLHPYIVYRSYGASSGLSGFDPPVLHAFFERILDAGLFETVTGKKASGTDTGRWFSFDERKGDSLCLMISRALDDTFPLVADTGDGTSTKVRVANSFIDASLFFRLTNPSDTSRLGAVPSSDLGMYFERSPHFTAFLYPDSVTRDVDWLNLSHAQWKHPATGETLYESIPDLFRQGVKEASSIISIASGFLSGAVTGEEFEQAVGNTSLSVRDSSGLPVLLCADPFPLSDELDKEICLRKKWLTSHLG